LEDNLQETDIAVIGMGCRLPGCNNTKEFWKNLINGNDLISTFTTAELELEGIPRSLFEQPNYVKRRGIISEIDQFDSEFFDITPAEADAMDPQQRLFLECCWEALEDSGYNPLEYKGLIGIFAGSGINQYFLKNIIKNKNIMEKLGHYSVLMLNDKDFLATRVAYKLNLRGPAITIQTACSTSLVAIHSACKSLLQGECDIAIAGGVSLSIPQKQGYIYKEGMIMSPDGYCRAFDAEANGTVSSSGLGIVILKMAKDAIDDRDFIHAIIKGSAINNDGNNKVGFTAPGLEGQSRVIEEALEISGINPREIGYVEAHGTGTKLGDSVEIEALTQAMKRYTQENGFCAIGSVKTNIGHTDTASGCAGLIKTILSLQHGQILPHLHYRSPNPHLNLHQTPFYITTHLKDWEAHDYSKKAAVSSFGIGGTNAHIIVEEAPKVHKAISTQQWYFVILSARSETALSQSAKNLLTYLEKSEYLESIGNIAYTLQVGRRAFKYRLAIKCQSKEDLIDHLKSKFQVNAPSTATDKADELKFGFISDIINEELFKHQKLILKKNLGEVNEIILDILKKHSIEIMPNENIRSSPHTFLFDLLVQLWLRGVNISWDLLYPHRPFQRIPLPTYPFERRRHWIHVESSPPLVQAQTKLEYVRQPCELRQKILKIWQEFLGIEQINIYDDFTKLGGDSFQAISLIDKINQDLECKLSVDALIKASTVDKIATLIEEKNVLANSTLPFSIVELQKGEKSKNPLFLIHPIGGAVYFYQELVSTLSQQQTVYGIQAQSLDEKTPPHSTIPAMAKHYISLIQHVQAKGPYYLGGASFGGAVAYEIALQLLNMGEEVKLVFLIDTPGPAYMPKKLNSTEEIISYLLKMEKNQEIPMKHLASMTEDKKIDYLIKHAPNTIPREFANKAKLFLKIFQANMKAMYLYEPKPFSGKCIFFAAEEKNDYIPQQLEMAWLPLVEKKLDVIYIPGNHITMNTLPYVKKMGKIMQQYLE
jgi:acyl transferase domain-containing protein